MKSEHDSKVAGHFSTDRTMELISQNFVWLNKEDNVRQYCQEFDNFQRMKSPKQAKHVLLPPLE